MLTVNDGPRNAVAERSFASEGEVERERERFVAVASKMTHDAYASADWQSVLNAV